MSGYHAMGQPLGPWRFARFLAFHAPSGIVDINRHGPSRPALHRRVQLCHDAEGAIYPAANTTGVMSTQIPGLLAIILYLLTSILLARRLFSRGEQTVRSKRGAIALGFGAALLHAGALYPLLITAGGLNLAFFNSFSFISVLTVLLLLIAAINRPVENLGVVVLPIAALSVALMLAYPTAHILSKGGSWQIKLHILLAISAFSILVLAAVQSIMLAIQDYMLRTRRPGGLAGTLPPMQVMESLLFQLIGAGFILLSTALITGILFLEDIFSQHLVHKTVLGIAAWLVFAVLLWGRWRFGWRGRVAIRWTLGGFVFLWLAYLGSKIVLELVLKH